MKKIVIILSIGLFLLNCTNNKPLPNGYDLLERENKTGVMPAVTLKPTHMARYWKTPITGGYTTLLLGQSMEVQASILLQCRNLIKIDTTQTLVSATLKLYGAWLFGEDSLMAVDMHRVNVSWDENSVLFADVADGYDADPVAHAEFTFHKDGWVDLPINNIEFMQEWISDSYKSDLTINGLLLKSTNNSTAEFVSADASANPAYIEILTENVDGNNDTTKAFLSHDATLLKFMTSEEENVLQEFPQSLRVGNASGYSSLIKFDVSAIPAQATIHRALLKFYIDEESSLTKTDASMFISAARIGGDSLWQPTTIEIDSSTMPAYDEASSVNETFAFDGATSAQAVSRIVQDWVSREETPNYGFLIMPRYPGEDFQEIALKTGATDSLFSPTLEITYSLPPSHRFAN